MLSFDVVHFVMFKLMDVRTSVLLGNFVCLLFTNIWKRGLYIFKLQEL